MTKVETKDERQRRLRAAGTWLREQREARGWSGSDLARRLDLNQVRVSAYERGQYEVPNAVAEGIATALDLPVVEVRQQLGLWVPDDADLEDLRRHADPTRLADDVLLGELVRRYQRRTDREIVNVYPYRSSVPGELWDRLIHDARSEISLGGYTNYFFWTERPGFNELLRAKAEAGVRVRILVGDPEHEVTLRREEIESAALSVSTRIHITLDELAKLGPVPGVEVRLSDQNAEAHVSRSIFRFDQEELVCEHIAERLGHGSLTFHMQKMQDNGPFSQYATHFEHLWDGGHLWTPPGAE
ncbi:helix-turn-helix domain-containing protein [Nocardiopsis sp. LOL_012]|uniref:helix-turn-helix domain-containing protein n=1 Tax=Nocardiopsis sp. LOL_012 TaxID=3345409 RepID=UPI003A89A5E7